MKGTKLFYSIFSVAILFLFACNSNDLSKEFRLNKKFWDPDDYTNAIHKIKFGNHEEKKPCYSVPEKAPIFRKIVDKNNISVVIEDEELGIIHRSEFASDMFDKYRNLVDLYQEIDREDKFIYPLELVEILKFGLYLQLHYFDLGNQAIIHNSDDPDEAYVKHLLKSNIQTLISNYSVYLGFIKQENSFTDEALQSYVDGIYKYFPMVIEKYPNADFSELIEKTRAMLDRSNSGLVKKSLTDLLDQLESEEIEE